MNLHFTRGWIAIRYIEDDSRLEASGVEADIVVFHVERNSSSSRR